MVVPARVAAFLDVAGQWNPALAFVMGGAIVVAAPAFAYARRHKNATIGVPFELPERFRITFRLVFGAVPFGIGWGLSGICPGPGIVLAGSLDTPALVFVGAVIVGSLPSDLIGGAAVVPRADFHPASPRDLSAGRSGEGLLTMPASSRRDKAWFLLYRP
jgi:uncharacterized protein